MFGLTRWMGKVYGMNDIQSQYIQMLSPYYYNIIEIVMIQSVYIFQIRL